MGKTLTQGYVNERRDRMIAHVSEDGLGREETVSEHTAKTEYLCQKKGSRCGIASIMSLCAVVHDMGKNKKTFDDYIHADTNSQKKLRGSIAHASTGAKYIYDKYHTSTNRKKILAELIAYAVAAHHGIFDCVKIDETDEFMRKLTDPQDYEEACRNADEDYLKEYAIDQLFTDALSEFDKIYSQMGSLGKKLQAGQNSDNTSRLAGWDRKQVYQYISFMLSALQRLMLSVLIDADWEATSDFMADIDSRTKQPVFDRKEIFVKAGENFASYMAKIQKERVERELSGKEKEILDARNILQKECMAFSGYPAGIYCLPIPTGGGKTLSSLAYALEFCKKYPETERIIYVSPYISITEQNAEVFREAVGNDAWIVEHHSAVIRDESNSEDYRTQKASGFDLNWEEPFICTTFVQFMNTLFSDKKQSIRRMHQLVHAVVIIDEVQSMPIKCIHTFNYMVNFLNLVCHTNIILCTATQPALKETKCPIHYSEPKHMIQNAQKWFHAFERVNIQMLGKYTYESLLDELVVQVEKFHSILVVLNTKHAVKTLYHMLQAKGVYAEYLTTNLCAQHRSDKIHSLKEKLQDKKEPVIVVSTNLIEAGVDISFACVYRSMAGLDSIAQTAGRCNRNGEADWGTVRLIELDDEHAGNMRELLKSQRITKEILYIYEHQNSRDSLLLPDWMDRYYEKLYKSSSDQMNFPVKKLNTNLLELLSVGFPLLNKKNLLNPAYQTAGKMYRVIQEDSLGIIVPYQEGKNLIEKLQEADDFREIKQYIRQAQRYTVNVRENQLKDLKALMEPVTDKISGLYMVAAPGAYHNDIGLTDEWEPLII